MTVEDPLCPKCGSALYDPSGGCLDCRGLRRLPAGSAAPISTKRCHQCRAPVFGARCLRCFPADGPRPVPATVDPGDTAHPTHGNATHPTLGNNARVDFEQDCKALLALLKDNFSGHWWMMNRVDSMYRSVHKRAELLGDSANSEELEAEYAAWLARRHEQ